MVALAERVGFVLSSPCGRCRDADSFTFGSVRLFESSKHGSTMFPLTDSTVLILKIYVTGGESGIRTHGTAVKAVHSISSRAPSTRLSHLSTNTKSLKVTYTPVSLILLRVSLFFGTIWKNSSSLSQTYSPQ